MSQARRFNDRRRRVLYTTHQSADEGATAARRRASAKLREARRPAAAYGARVNRRLRGRWFSLVPIKRRSLIAFVLVITTLCVGLSVMHHLAMTWPPLASADRFDVARPFLLDRHDSLGRWVIATIYALTAGTMLLIYQLRRYRNDDFQGHYRLWRLALVVTLITSIDSLVGLVSWTGALLDVAMGKRAALQGGDWLRILCSFAGAIFALRLVVEVRRSRAAMISMITGWAWFAIPVAARWHFMPANTVGRLTLVSIAPLLASGAFWVSTVIYLRMLVREVRGIQDDGLSFQRVKNYAAQWKENRQIEEPPEKPTRAKIQPRETKPTTVTAAARPTVTSATKPESSPSDSQPRSATRKDSPSNSEPKRGWFRRRKQATKSTDKTSVTPKVNTESPPESNAPSKEKENPNKRSFLRWPFRKGSKGSSERGKDDSSKSESQQQQAQGATRDGGPKDSSSESQSPRRSRFSFRLQPKARTTPKQSSSENPKSKSEDLTGKESTKEETPAKPSGIRGWLGRRKPSQAESSSDTKVESKDSAKSTASTPPAASSGKTSVVRPEPTAEIDENNVDWTSMSKSERRRLRKQLKRQGRAA